jgi:hypothetical protein
MNQMWLLALMAGCGALTLMAIVVMYLQQEEHKRNGMLPAPDPRLSLPSVLGLAPIRRVRAGGVAFADGSGLLFSHPDRENLAALGRLAAVRDVVLERVYELSAGMRLVFRGGDTRLPVDVESLQVVLPASDAG